MYETCRHGSELEGETEALSADIGYVDIGLYLAWSQAIAAVS